MAVSVYDEQNLSTEDQEKLTGLTTQWDTLKASGASDDELSAIHDQAEAIRSTANYSGTTDGSGYVGFNTNDPNAYPESAFPTVTSQEDYIKDLYTAQNNASVAGLTAAYEQNLIDLDAAEAKIPEYYQAAANQADAQSEIAKSNFNEYAKGSGVNSGAGSQATLSMNNANNANQSAIQSAKADALAELETQRTKLKAQYENDVAVAIAQGDFSQAQALLAEAQRVDESLVTQAYAEMEYAQNKWTAEQELALQNQTLLRQKADDLASYGDFSAYLDLGYSEEAVQNMYDTWAKLNPLLAQSTDYPIYNPDVSDDNVDYAIVNPLDDMNKFLANFKFDPVGSFLSGDTGESAPTVAQEVASLQKQGFNQQQIVGAMQQFLADGEITGAEYNAYIQAMGG